MILCVLDDLMFSVKISTAAKSLGAAVFFERKPDDVVPHVRDKRPSLVIFDLNSTRLRPMEAIAALKADPKLAGINTLGYVSHVDTATIARARRAGVDEALAGTAYIERLGEYFSR